eukprot:gene30240-39452_t
MSFTAGDPTVGRSDLRATSDPSGRRLTLSQENSSNNNQQSGITETVTVNAYSSDFKLSGSCKPCGDIIGSCGICRVDVVPNSAFCSYHGTHTQNVYWNNYGSCHNCGGRTVDSGTCSCNKGYGGTNCVDACDPGSYAFAGSNQCLPCPAGNYSSTAASGTCTACLPGTYAPIAGLKACATCPNGFEAPHFGSIACQAVPTRTPTANPSVQPVHLPTANPSLPPVHLPTVNPSAQPVTLFPSPVPTVNPSAQPVTLFPSPVITANPSVQPVTPHPTSAPVPLQAASFCDQYCPTLIGVGAAIVIIMMVMVIQNAVESTFELTCIDTIVKSHQSASDCFPIDYFCILPVESLDKMVPAKTSPLYKASTERITEDLTNVYLAPQETTHLLPHRGTCTACLPGTYAPIEHPELQLLAINPSVQPVTLFPSPVITANPSAQPVTLYPTSAPVPLQKSTYQIAYGEAIEFATIQYGKKADTPNKKDFPLENGRSITIPNVEQLRIEESVLKTSKKIQNKD